MGCDGITQNAEGLRRVAKGTDAFLHQSDQAELKYRGSVLEQTVSKCFPFHIMNGSHKMHKDKTSVQV